MMRRCVLFASVIVLLMVALVFGQTTQQVPSTVNAPMTPQVVTIPSLPNLQNGTPQAGCVTLESLTPEQRNIIESELNKTGGRITLQTVEALKSRPELQNICPNEISRAKDFFQKKEKGDEKQEAKRPTQIPNLQQTSIGKPLVGPANGKAESLFDRYRSTGSYQDISIDLKPFGFDFFQESSVSVAAERKDVPVPGDYVVGPGDEVKLFFWGRLNAQHNLLVDRDGNITIPQVGPVKVGGMTFEEMSKHLIKQSESMVGANIDVTMGSLKSIPIFVLGDVKRPGAYTIGSFATVTDALLIAGGPSGIGSLRHVQLRRKEKTVTTFDFYDLLIKGDKSKDAILQAGDVVFVPVVGPLVGVAGNVKRPAIYELKEKTNLKTLFDLAGGIIPTANTQQIQVERFIKNERQVVVDINDKELMRAKEIMLHDGDLVKVFNIVDKDVNAIYVEGNIKRPGKYEFRDGMRVSHVIKGVDGLLAETDMNYAVIKRLKPPQLEPELIPFNLGKAIGGKDHSEDKVLMARDTISIFSKWTFQEKPSLVVDGEVRSAGKFDLADNMTIKDAILLAGGLTTNAYLQYAELYRTDKITKKVSLVKFNPRKVLDGDKEENMVLKDQDRIMIHSVLGYEYQKTVTIDGEVLRPGEFQYTENMTVRDLVLAAGNIKESAYLDQAELSSQVIESGDKAKTVHRKVNLRAALNGSDAENVVLKPYDRLFVKPLTNWRRERYVTVNGEIRFPGKYILHEGEKLSEVIERAGGYKENAYLRGAVFTRSSVQVLQQKNISEMADRLERDLYTGNATVTSISAEGMEAKKIEIQQKRAFIESLRNLKATGRMTVRLAHVRLLKGSPFDIEMEDGDALYIPMNNRVVNVMGAVMSNASLVYVETLKPGDYIDMAGGYTRYADDGNTYVLKVDGSARRIPGRINWNWNRQRWEMGAFGEETQSVEPGDTIVVPEKLERIAWLREIKDITQIVANIAVAAGAVYLFGR